MPEEARIPVPPSKVETVDVESDKLQDFQIPTFVNCVNIWHFGSDVYVEMALLTIEQMNSYKPGGDLTVVIHDRYAMSPRVFDDFARRVSLVRGQLIAEGLIPNATAEPSPG